MPGPNDKSKNSARKTFGRRLRVLREEQGFSQESLAELSGIHRTYVSSIERGERNVGFDNILKIAAALEVPPGSLFEDLDGI